LLKQLVTEGSILCMLDACGGLIVAHWCRHALVLLFPARGGVSMYLPGDLDWRVLVLTSGVCLLSTLLLGLVPAICCTSSLFPGICGENSASRT
jgi:hypothetical protein